MERLSTANTYHSALLNILSAQSRQTTAQSQVATGKVADSLKGFNTHADTLTATRSLAARIDGYIDGAKTLSATLDVQDQALGQLADVTQQARAAVADALAAGSAEGLMSALGGYLGRTVDTLNTEYQGRRLFAGGKTDTAPLASLDMTALAAAPSVPALFANDQMAISRRLDDSLTLKTNFFADDLGAPTLQAMQAVAQLDAGPLGPLAGTLTQAQQTALQGILQQFDDAWGGLNEAVAENGGIQSRVASIQNSLDDRRATLEGVMGDITNVDMAEAISRLEMARTALDASAQVFGTLQASSLLNVLGMR